MYRLMPKEVGLKFRDLSNISFPVFETQNSIERLKNEFGVIAPDSVIEQFYIDHSDKHEFQKLYGEVDLNLIEWDLIELNLDEIRNLGYSATHPDFIGEVLEGVSQFNNIGFAAIDCRENVITHWQKFGTWLTPPIFIKGEVIGKPAINIHLVEGHTRVGCLLGVSKYKVMEVAQIHAAYLGKLKASSSPQ